MANTNFSGSIVQCDNGFEGPINVGSGGQLTLIKKAAVSVNLPSINDGAIAEVTVTVSGAVAGDAVIANPPAAIAAGLGFVGAFVSAADSVKIRVVNLSGAPIDEAAANWVFTLIR
jgi:hypothetical protein